MSESMVFGLIILAMLIVLIGALYQINRPPKPKPWDGEWKLEDNTTPMETRILNALKKRITPLNPSVWFSGLRWECRGSDDNFDQNEFYDTLLRLESEGKVVRVSDATTEHDSLWALPEGEEEEEQCDNTDG